MPLRSPQARERQRTRRIVLMSVAAGTVAVAAIVAIVVLALSEGDRPEEGVARAYLEAVFAGDGDTAYDLGTLGFRAVVFPRDVEALADAAAEIVGPEASVRIVGSQRSPTGTAQSAVGYTGRTAVGEVRGVVTLVQEGDVWRVYDFSFRFPDATPEQTAPLDELVAALNEQLAQRSSVVTDPSPSVPEPTVAPTP